MKFFVTLIVVSLALVNAQVPTASCTASGDPHFKTFDGCYHDFQGNGVFQAVKNRYLEVQYLAKPCNPPHAVTCITALYTSIQNPDLGIAPSVVVCNYADASGYYCVIDGVRYNWANLATAVPLKNGLGSVSRDGGYTAVSALRGGWKVRGAIYQMIVDLPFSMGFLGETYGVCGFFDNNAVNDFTGANKVQFEKCAFNTRVNNDNVNRWGASFFASPFALNGQVSLLADRQFFEQHNMQLLDEPDIPNSTVQDQLNKLTFSNFDAYTDARKKCEASSQSTDPAAIENCVYDAAVLGNFDLAATNQQASLNAGTQSSSSSGLNGGAIAGIVLGCVAFVTLVTALVLYVRLHKLRAEYSRALIVRSQPQGTAANTNALADNL